MIVMDSSSPALSRRLPGENGLSASPNPPTISVVNTLTANDRTRRPPSVKCARHCGVSEGL